MSFRHLWVYRPFLIAFLLGAQCVQPASAQRPPAQPHAGELLHRMKKLNVLGSVLYIAAHPDDENTRMIAWLANGRNLRTAYLSLTRGEGGQNLIGSELGDPLGIIRTQELLEARRIDGGEQFFTRAVDFGYSKTADESFEKWGKEEILSDVVRVIRTFRPDVIITRFPADGGGGHGHHTASAILAHEAFDLAGDPAAFPDQIEEGLEIWKPKRLFFNGSSWWRKDLGELAKNDPKWFTVDVGGYDPLLGLSYTELAGRSRSMHKSQGFGSEQRRGETLEYLHLEKGERPAIPDIFDAINISWSRIIGGDQIGKLAEQMIRAFDPHAPERSIQQLVLIREAIADLPASTWRDQKLKETDDLIVACSGLSLEFLSPSPSVSIADTLTYQLQAVLRRPETMRLNSIGMNGKELASVERSLDPNVVVEIPLTLMPGERMDQPFWLNEPHGNLYAIERPEDRIKATLDNQLLITANSQVKDNVPIEHQVPMMDKWVDRVAGERIRPVYVTPVASVTPKTHVLIARGGTQHVVADIEALTDGLTGRLNISLPEGWMTTKDLKVVDIPNRGGVQSFTFQITAMDNAQAGRITFEFSGPKGKSAWTMHEIDHPHIMPQIWYSPAEVRLVPLDVQVTAQRVGYVKGAGDDVPQALEELGVHVDMIEPATATSESLAEFDAIVTGIRAYNTTKALKHLQPLLMEYVENGGTLVVQYNTTPRFNVSGVSDMVIDPDAIGPKPFKIGRGRVSVEEATPKFINASHPLLNHPNKITTQDFEGWVQERGLYFAEEFEPEYTPLIEWNDPSEKPLNGALIVMDHGKGRYIYTGISFFRQLPAGVPGAYRLFANLISPRNGATGEKKDHIER